jgi:hypothetical protein
MAERKDEDGKSKSTHLVSPYQVAGGALASVTAAYLGSRLGVAGTFWGAGLTSVVISVGGAVYQRSLEGAKDKAATAAAKTALTRAKRLPLALAPRPAESDAEDVTSDVALSTEDLDRLRRARSTLELAPVAIDPAPEATRRIHPVPGAVRPGMHWPGGDHVVDDPPVVDSSEPTIRLDAEDAVAESAESPSTATKLIEVEALPVQPSRRIRWAAVAATSVLVFGVCILLITGFEGVTGAPLSGGQRGTSVGRVVRPDPPSTPVPPRQPAATTRGDRPSRSSQPATTVQPAQPPPAEPAGPAPPPRQEPSSQQPVPTSSAPPTTTTSTTQQAPLSVFPSQ